MSQDNVIKYDDFAKREPWSSRFAYQWHLCQTGQVLAIDLLNLGADAGPVNAQVIRRDAASRIVKSAQQRASKAGQKVAVVCRKPWLSVFLRFDPK